MTVSASDGPFWTANRPHWTMWLKFAAVLAVFPAGAWIGHLVAADDAVRQSVASYGYLGVFFIALISGFNLAIPIPAVVFLPVFLLSGLEFWLVTAIIAVGVSLADCTAFLLGSAGRGLVPAKYHAFVRRLERIRERRQWAPLAALFGWVMLSPLPNEVVLVPPRTHGVPAAASYPDRAYR